MPQFKRNHVISESLLARFKDDQARICRHDIATGNSQPIPISGQGYTKSLWRRTSAATMEKLWSDQAETAMYGVYDKLDAGKGLTRNQKDTLKRFLTIHFIRSNKFIKIYKDVAAQKCEVDHEDKRLSFSMRYQVRLSLLKETQIPSEFFEKQMTEYYYKCLGYLRKFNVEIGVATQDKTFILPDGGLFLADTSEHKTVTPVPILQATNAILPLGPRHIAAFTSKTPSGYRPLTDIHVSRANTNLKLASIKAYYSQTS